MQWEVEYTDQFETWWHTLADQDQERIAAGVELLAQHRPDLGRPTVDTIISSRHPNMKELRAGNIRTLFAFDPCRAAILLIGGDKSGQWNAWYKAMIPVADDLYDEHLDTLTNEGLI